MVNLDAAIERARRQLLGRRRADGAFPDTADLGPAYTAFPLIALHYAEHDLPASDVEKVVTGLRRQQRADGSFVGYPGAAAGDLCATAAVWAALRSAGLAETDDAVARAYQFVERHGGLDEVARSLYTRTNFAALFVAMAGFIDPAKIPMPPPVLVLNPLAEAYLKAKFDFTTLASAIVCGGAIVDALRRERAAAAPHPDGFFAEVAARIRAIGDKVVNTVESLDDGRAIAFLERFQNPNGSLDDTTLQTALLVAGYRALRLPQDDARVERAAGWLRAMLLRNGDEASWNAFTGDIWSTSLALRALVMSGSTPADADIQETVRWLLGAQIRDEARVVCRPRPGAPLTGGWGFESGNVTTPDCDDTGLVLAALGITIDESGKSGPPDAIASNLVTGVEQACRWLEGNQDPDGGWSAFDYTEATKPRGPMYQKEIGLLSNDLFSTLENFIHPPPGLGSPAWEDVTGRVLFGLGYAGYATESQVVARALGFLRGQQLDDGSWWGRWMVNYLPTTSYILLGLAAIALPPDDPMVKRAIAFILSRQNADGGWGEDEDTYPDPSRAGRGPSMPPLTGLVLSALIDIGQGESDAVKRGVDYLLAQQRGDGTWPNGGWLHAFFPPQSFYVYGMMPALYPLEALGRYRRLELHESRDRSSTDPASLARANELLKPVPVPARPTTWTTEFLESMRRLGDPTADLVIKELFDAHQTEAVNHLMRSLVRSDEPVPSGIPEVARRYFESTAVLPAWADQAKIEAAQQLFLRVGWPIAASLFCASLPQTYCCAKGAKVLLMSGRLDVDPRRRILETAQFVFDVTDENGLGPEGRGIRAAQKVRLMHSTLRHLTLIQARWDMDDGLPINQEDLAATLMTFSTVILEALDRFGIETTSDEREAWMHLWLVVGSLLGIDSQIMPKDEHDGAALMDAVRRHQWVMSPQGQFLAKALWECMQEYMPSSALKSLPAALIRHLAGDWCAELLAVPRADWMMLLVDAADDVLSVLDRTKRDAHIGRLMDRFSTELMQAIITVQRGGKQAPFRIPASLRST